MRVLGLLLLLVVGEVHGLIDGQPSLPIVRTQYFLPFCFLLLLLHHSTATQFVLLGVLEGDWLKTQGARHHGLCAAIPVRVLRVTM